jgi:hypothetical protein
VVLEPGHEHGIAFPQFFLAGKRISQQVDGFRGVTRENRFFETRIHKTAHACVGLLVQFGCFLAQGMLAAVHVRSMVFIKISHRFNDLPGLLRGRSIVQVNQWFSVHLPGKNRKVTADFLRIHHNTNFFSICSFFPVDFSIFP